MKTNQCPEIPFFGAKYPDATCINGMLWDLDSSEENGLTKGGEDPCPFCNSQAVIERMIDDEVITSVEEGKELIKNMWTKYNYTETNDN